ncbi:IclR family transcriptional regulator [Phytoactinopolyspora halotolerans]|uniref:IclR family transcriptional regulator n=1 Tax=Phytoactinopolyspora halotolerans TaxID=1981512 RepID=A0A6L9S7R6_9ACTN|nr:IclR family transcriptional regulator [Phytoactinopolyspora halotolerans]NEE01067.1 IclR family transcriptional regulator [Phytoactinopolyspora halotolerans]
MIGLHTHETVSATGTLTGDGDDATGFASGEYTTPDAFPQARRSSVERVHRLLSSFDYEHTRLRLSELSRRAGLPLSTTHRMVTELLELGMLERDEDNFLCVGVAVWKFGLLTPKTYGIQRVALPFMQDLYATTRLPIHLGIPQGNQTTIVESLRPQGTGQERPRIGQRDPLHVTAVGTALLAFCDSGFQERYLTDLKDHQGADAPEMIRRELAQTRATGCAISKRKTAPNIAIGAPVLDRAGRPLGAVSLVVPEGTSTPPYDHLIRCTARAVQRTAWEQGVA